MARTPVRPQQAIKELKDAECKEEMEDLRTPEDRMMRPGPSPKEGKGGKGKNDRRDEEDPMGGQEPLVVFLATPPEV